MVPDTDQTNRLGINAVALIFERIGWIFREQPTSDYGIDAQAEMRSPDGKGEGKLIGLQIKSGASYFRKRGTDYVYYGEARHLEYWSNHCLPVFLILHDPTSGLTLWQRVTLHLVEVTEEGRWSLTIPASQTLDTDHAPAIAQGVASDLGSLRRARLTLDLPYIRTFAEHETIYMRIDDYVNKTLNMRGAEFTFSGQSDGEADVYLDVNMPCYTVDYYMAVAFPWLDWELEGYIDESEGAYEVAQHILRVEVNDVGKAALRLEAFYASDLPPFRPEASDLDEAIYDDRYEDDL